MIKQTVKSYTRRKVVLGVCLLGSLSLIGTGFAAWVISTQQNGTANGNIAIGEVKDNTVHFTDVKLSAENIYFEPNSTDNTGRVRYDGTNAENLETTLSFYIDNYTYVASINVQLVVPAGIMTAKGSESTSKYITLPACAVKDEGTASTENIVLDSPAEGTTVADATKNDSNVTLTGGKKITYLIKFGWGTFFNSENPGLYYDDNGTGGGAAITDANMKTALESFHNLLSSSAQMTVNLAVTLN